MFELRKTHIEDVDLLRFENGKKERNEEKDQDGDSQLITFASVGNVRVALVARLALAEMLPIRLSATASPKRPWTCKIAIFSQFRCCSGAPQTIP